jgi:DNA processing protein
MSAGCHLLLREDLGARLVTTAAEVVEEVGRLGDDLAPRPDGEHRSRDALAPMLREVLESVPAVRAAGPAVLAGSTGLELVTLRRTLGQLISEGFVEITDQGYRLSARERAAVRQRAKGAIGML